MLVTPERRQGQERRDAQLGRVAAQEFAPATSSVTEARHWAEGVARSWGLTEEVLDRLAVNVTELAANAVIHARSPFRARLRLAGGIVRLEVEDASPEPPRALRAAPEATAGRGFAIVSALSRRTGVESVDERGKRVWAEIDA